MIRVLYDAWDWVYEPHGPAAWRLARLLPRLPEGITPLLALPGHLPSSPPWPQVVVEVPQTPWGRLRWEQWVLPRLARRNKVTLLHVFHGPPLWSPVPVVHDGVLPDTPAEATFPMRLRASLARGGATQAQAFPQAFEKAFQAWPPPIDPPPALPEERLVAARYVVAYGPWEESGLATLLQSWSWVAQGLGAEVTLYLLGLRPHQERLVQKWLDKVPWSAQVQALKLPPWEALGVLRRAEALLQVGWSRYHAEVVGAALALGVPVVGLEVPPLAALLGPAGYLVPPEDDRALGGALIAVLVEEHLAADLRRRARQRAQAWPNGAFAQSLTNWYRRLVEGG